MPKKTDTGQDSEQNISPTQATESEQDTSLTQDTAMPTERKEAKEREVKVQPEEVQIRNALQGESGAKSIIATLLDQKDSATLTTVARGLDFRKITRSRHHVIIPTSVKNPEEIIRILKQYQQPDSKEDNESNPKNNITSLDLSECRHMVTDQLLKTISDMLPSLKTLNLSLCKGITDAGLANLSALTSLQSLNLSWCEEITNTGLANLSALTSLQILDLYGCKKITDAGLDHLRGLTSLQTLSLWRCTAITNAGLAYLSNLPLRSINLSSTGATYKEWQALKTATSERDKQDQKIPVEHSSSQVLPLSGLTSQSAAQEQGQKQTTRRMPGVTEPLPPTTADSNFPRQSIEINSRPDIIPEGVETKAEEYLSQNEEKGVPSPEVKNPEGSRKGGGKNNGCCTIL